MYNDILPFTKLEKEPICKIITKFARYQKNSGISAAPDILALILQKMALIDEYLKYIADDRNQTTEYLFVSPQHKKRALKFKVMCRTIEIVYENLAC